MDNRMIYPPDSDRAPTPNDVQSEDDELDEPFEPADWYEDSTAYNVGFEEGVQRGYDRGYADGLQAGLARASYERQFSESVNSRRDFDDHRDHHNYYKP